MALGRRAACAASAAFVAVFAVGAASVARSESLDAVRPGVSTSARNSYDGKLCYDDGERAIGAPGFARVPYMPCCSGKPPLPMDAAAKSYSAASDWGLWCGGTGKVVVSKDCYEAKERAIGAPGRPHVEYKPCCDGREPQSKYDDWGKFCGYAAPEAPKPMVAEERIPVKCAGEEGYPYVPFVDCGYGMKCAREAKYGWGHFCVPAGGSCYGPGAKGQGAVGHPAITYLPCCDGQEQVQKAGEWGKFCPGKRDLVYEAPKPNYSKPVAAPRNYEPPSPPKGYAPPTYEPADSSHPTYPYPIVKPSNATKAPRTTIAMYTTIPSVKSTTSTGIRIVDREGCRSSGTPAVTGPEFTESIVGETSVEFEVPFCVHDTDGDGIFTQDDADSLIWSFCDRAEVTDSTSQCRIETLPSLDNLVSNSLGPGLRGTMVVVIGWTRFPEDNHAEFRDDIEWRHDLRAVTFLPSQTSEA